MKGRDNKGMIIKKKRSPSADLLVCFPSRAHLALLPKAICSPARPNDPNNRHHQHYRQLQLKKLTSGVAGSGPGGLASPLPWTKNNNNEVSEPTSPKVTCAGQIKVRHKTGQCKSWQSVMEEIEKIHNKNKMKKKASWGESLGFKKEIMQFLTCLRNIKFDFRCLGAFPQPDITSDEDEEEEDDDGEESSKTVFSKWFMVMQENNNNSTNGNNRRKDEEDEDEFVEEPVVPPKNALLLMRCRSAPAKSRLVEEKDQSNFDDELDKENNIEEEKCVKKTKSLKLLMEEENVNEKKNLVVMRYENDLYKISTDIAKETWVVSGIRDPIMSRSTSWKS
ncbi:hypothetical protein ACFE04_025425 [Oxalis oulophora]